MMGHPEETRLSDWVDGLLPAADAELVERHLAGCPACRAEAEGLRELLAEAAALPRGIEPERELWSGIAERIQDDGVLELSQGAARRERGRAGAPSPWPMRFALAAAAGLLVVASSGITLLVLRGPGQAPVAAAPAAPADGLRLASHVERGYSDAVRELESSLALRGGELRPETVAVIEENLQIIDEAIAAAGEALAQDPANVELAQKLRHAYRQKVELLERAVKLQRT